MYAIPAKMQILQTIFSNATKKITRATAGLPSSLHLNELWGTNKWQQAQLIIFINPQHKYDNAIGKSLKDHKSLATAPVLCYREDDIPKNTRNPIIILNSEADEKLFQKELNEASANLEQESHIRQEYNSIYFSATLAAMKISDHNTRINLKNIKNAVKDFKEIFETGNCSDAAPLKTIPNEPQEFAIAYKELAHVKAAEQRFNEAVAQAQEILNQKQGSDLGILSHALKTHSTQQKVLILNRHTDKYLSGLKNICQELNISYALIKPA